MSTSTVSRTTTIRSSSGGGVGGGVVTGSREEMSTYQPKSSVKSVIVQRGGGYGRNRGSGMYGGVSGTFSSRVSSHFNPAVYSQVAGAGIADFRDHREKEKREMQDCNERLATYIEKVRWLEAQNKRLEAELEALRNRKAEDWKPIRDMFEGELDQARQVIQDLSTEKGVNEAKLASLQDEIQSLRDLISTYENHCKDYTKKIDQLNSQIGEYEGEINTLRLRCGSLEDENCKLRELNTKYRDEIARLRADLDAETAAHIEQEVACKTKEEECDFYRELVDKLQVTQQEPVTVKGQDMEAFFKGEIREAVRSIQQVYDDKLDQMSMECEAKVASQVNQLRSGNVRDSMEAEHAKTESKRYRDQLNERNARIAALESELAAMKCEKDALAAQLAELQLEMDRMQMEHARKLNEFQMQVEALMAQLKDMMDAKMSLELEIACYKTLLEGEENRSGLRQLVESQLGVRSSGASHLADMIGSSSSSVAQMRVQRRSTGVASFGNVDPTGGFVDIQVDQSARGPLSLQGVKLVKMLNGKELVNIDLGSGSLKNLEKGGTMKVCARAFKSKADNDHEICCDTYSFGQSGDFYLQDATGKQLASMALSQSM